ncbi:MAG TPA: VWA domain-containing protein [Candidatus Angelobacter sp.]|nr:VWA domain-containing protein [Candidatus Angelobacter sp.]
MTLHSIAHEPDGLAATIIEFCRFARSNGASAGIGESVDALTAVQTIGVTDREAFKLALRAVLCSSKEEWDLFDSIFEDFWSSPERRSRSTLRGRERNKPFNEDQRQSQSSVVTLLGQAGADRADDDGGRAVVGATAHERLKKTDFSEVSQADMAELERLSLRLLKQMSRRLSRKLQRVRPQGQVDLRRTIRLSIARGGDPIYLSLKGKKLQPDRLVILLDISGSMNPYSLFLVRFAYTLQKYFKRVSTFLFSTHLAEITPALRARKLREALQALSQQAAGWSGGTKIGESLRNFNFVYGRKLLSRNTVFMVLSDGWDTGEPEVLAGELAAIKRRVRKLVWLNPLLGMEGYEPITRGMSAALPYINVFASAHNLQSLLALETHLTRN